MSTETIEVLNRLTPIIVCMAPDDTLDLRRRHPTDEETDDA